MIDKTNFFFYNYFLLHFIFYLNFSYNFLHLPSSNLPESDLLLPIFDGETSSKSSSCYVFTIDLDSEALSYVINISFVFYENISNKSLIANLLRL